MDKEFKQFAKGIAIFYISVLTLAFGGIIALMYFANLFFL